MEPEKAAEKKTKKRPAVYVAYLGCFLALSVLLSYVETLLPVFPYAPGVKVGLANIVVLLVLYRMDATSAVAVSLLRVGIMSLLFGNVSVFLYSFFGAFLSLLGMIFIKKLPIFGPVGVSIAGGVLHNAGQILVACFLFETGLLLYYLPVLILSGTIAGAVVGLIGAGLYRLIPARLFEKAKGE